jgi:hypothetical protein
MAADRQTSRSRVAITLRVRLIPAQRGAHSPAMIQPRRLLPILALATGLAVAWNAGAAEPEAVATAPPAGAGAPPMTVADQIDAYLKSSPALALPQEGANGVTSGAEEPRKIHGMVEVAAGTNGYRSAYVQSDIPVGKTGTLSVAAGETRFDGRVRGYGYGYGPANRQSLSIGLALGGGEALDPRDPRCRQFRDDRADFGPDARFGGARSHGCRTEALPSPEPPAAP